MKLIRDSIPGYVPPSPLTQLKSSTRRFLVGMMFFITAATLALLIFAASRLMSDKTYSIHDAAWVATQLRAEYLNFRARLLEAQHFGLDGDRLSRVEASYEILTSRFTTISEGFYLRLLPPDDRMIPLYNDLRTTVASWGPEVALVMSGDRSAAIALHAKSGEANLRFADLALSFNHFVTATIARTERRLNQTIMATLVCAVLSAVILAFAANRMLSNARSVDIAQRELSNALAALSAAKDRAEQASDSKTAFLANMSHELRTPLNAVLGFAEMLAHKEAMALSKAKEAEYIGYILSSGRHLLSLINDVLDFSKLQNESWPIELRTHDLEALLSGFVATMSAASQKKGITIHLELENGFRSVRTDERALQQVMLNVLSNAVKFSPPSSDVRVRVGAADGDDRVRIEVTDQGPGLDEVTLAHVGTPYFQGRNPTYSSESGTGLGLTIAIELLKRVEGRFSIGNRESGGAIVTIDLPKVDVETALEVCAA
jgi:signal transduction histidine kinase